MRLPRRYAPRNDRRMDSRVRGNDIGRGGNDRRTSRMTEKERRVQRIKPICLFFILFDGDRLPEKAG